MNGIVIVVEPVEIVDKKLTAIYMGERHPITPGCCTKFSHWVKTCLWKDSGKLIHRILHSNWLYMTNPYFGRDDGPGPYMGVGLS